jgi:EmrB/QacA subfamily drug resistance transporter
MAFLDVTIVNVAFPHIQRSFPGSTRSELSWVLTGYNVVFSALLIPAGRLADLVGRRRLFLLGLAGFTAASGLCAVAPSLPALVACRLLQAVGAAAVIPTVVALLLPEFPPERRIGAVALLGVGAAVAAGAGPPLGGLLIEAADWRLVFLINVPLGCVAALLGARMLQESRDPDRGRVPDPLGVTLLAAGLGSLVLGVVQGNEWGWASVPTLSALAAGLLLPALAIARSRRHRSPVIEVGLLRVPSVRSANAAMLCLAISLHGKILCDVLYLTWTWGYPMPIVGLALAVGPLVTAVCAASAGRLADRHGARVTACCGAALYAAGSIWLVLRAGPHRAYVADFLPTSLLTGVGNALAFPTLTSAAVTGLSYARYATGSALNATARQLGAVVGVAVVVAILGSATVAPDLAELHSGWLFTGLAGAAATVAGLTLPRRAPALVEPVDHRGHAYSGSPALERLRA